MGDFMNNMQDVYKKWESKAAPRYGPRRRGFNHSSDMRYGGTSESSSRYNQQRACGRTYRNHSRFPKASVPKFHGIAQFKMTPSILAENKARPFMGHCCSKCFPQSRAAKFDESVFYLGIGNVLHIPPISWNMYSYAKRFSIYSLWKRNWTLNYPDVTEKVLHSERVLHSVELTEADCGDSETSNKCDRDLRVKHVLDAKKTLYHMKASVSVVLLRIVNWALHGVLTKIFDGILVHKGQMEILEMIEKVEAPIIYVPIHQSNLDYFLIAFILYMHNLRIPLLASCDNVQNSFLSYLMQLLGAFFIRKQQNSQCRVENSIYNAVLESYVTECLKVGHNLEFFIEGKRSRSGKAQRPKTSLLSIIVDAVLKEHIDDAYVVPVSVSYEKIIEESFASEQLGQPREKESFFSILGFLWRMLHSSYGNIRLNFGQPYSLGEFLHSSKFSSSFTHKSSMETPPVSPHSVSSADESCYGDDFNRSDKPEITKYLADHIIYDAVNSTALMSTHLVSFLLLNQFRKGATQQQLQYSLDWLRDELNKKKRDLGFRGESLCVIKQATNFLGSNLITSETVEMEWMSSDMENNNVKVVIYKPVVELPYVLELQYYANKVVPVFLLDSLIVNAIYALIDVEICHFLQCDSKLCITRDELMEKAIELSDILQFEFLCVSPCSDISVHLNDALEDLITKECLHMVGMTVSDRTASYNRRSTEFSFESDDEIDYQSKERQLKIDLSEDSIRHLEFLRNILSPYIESYWLAASALLKLVHEVKEASVFIREMQMLAQDRLYKGLLGYEESFSAETFKNALKLFEHWHVTEHYKFDGVKIVYLHDSYNSDEKISDVIAKIEEFRK